MAEAGGFEPPVTCATPVFKTGAFGRSATPPFVPDPIRQVPGVQRDACECHQVTPDGSTFGSNAALPLFGFLVWRTSGGPEQCLMEPEISGAELAQGMRNLNSDD